MSPARGEPNTLRDPDAAVAYHRDRARRALRVLRWASDRGNSRYHMAARTIHHYSASRRAHADGVIDGRLLP